MSKFISTEGNCGPGIVLSRTPVPRPPDIVRGAAITFRSALVEGRDQAKIVSFRSRYSGFSVTYHNVPVKRWNGDMIEVVVGPEIVVTWEPIEP